MLDQELPLEIRKELAKETHRNNVEEFGLDKSERFRQAFEKMTGMDHGPNHTEGDPAVHTFLVEFEMSQFLQMQEHGISVEDQKILRLATVLHDVGKADTQKFDVVSKTQNELVGVNDEEIEKANDFILQLLSEVSNKSIEILKSLSKGALGKIKTEYIEGLQEKLRIMSEKGELKKYPAIVANFRGHDKVSAEMINEIIFELGISLEENETKDLDFVVKNHMLLLDPEKVTPEQFKSNFVMENGEFDDRKISLLRAHAHADNAGTINKKHRDARSLLERIDDSIEKLKNEYLFAKKKEDEIVKAQVFEQEVFGGTVAAYLQLRGLEQGPSLGKAIGRVKSEMDKLKKENPSISSLEMLKKLDGLIF
jgi:hypothetical protein